tara:strand:- start:2511 stop:2624 length:114 start_codon:yes stop_codon:yes gene_type:complete
VPLVFSPAINGGIVDKEAIEKAISDFLNIKSFIFLIN